MSKKNGKPKARVVGNVPTVEIQTVDVEETPIPEVETEIVPESESEKSDPPAPIPVRYLEIKIPVFTGDVPVSQNVFEQQCLPSTAVHVRLLGGNRPRYLRTALQRLRKGLQAEHAMLRNPDGIPVTHVDTYPQAFEYLLQQIAAAVGDAPGEQEPDLPASGEKADAAAEQESTAEPEPESEQEEPEEEEPPILDEQTDVN